MNLTVSVPKETFPGEHHVALVPPIIPFLTKQGCSVLIEAEAGTAAGFSDTAYKEKGHGSLLSEPRPLTPPM